MTRLESVREREVNSDKEVNFSGKLVANTEIDASKALARRESERKEIG